MNAISFTVNQSISDFDEAAGGWHCSALAIPGAKIRSALVGGLHVDRSCYEVLKDRSMVRWVAENRPQQISFEIDLDERLSAASEVSRWKRLSIVPAAVLAVISAGMAAFTIHQHYSTALDPSFVAFPMGDKVCLFSGIFSRHKEATLASALAVNGISVVDFYDNIMAVYSTLSGKPVEDLGFTYQNAAYCEGIVNSGAESSRKYARFQMFQQENEISVSFSFKGGNSAVVPPDEVGVDWDRFTQGMRRLLRQLKNDKVDFEFGKVEVRQLPRGGVDYRIAYRKM